MQYRGLVQVAAKWLLARFMPKHRAASIGPDRPTKKGPSQQSPLRYPPGASFCTEFIKTEQHEGNQVDERKGGGGVGEGEEGGEVHDIVKLSGL